jgi:hypothetical protein
VLPMTTRMSGRSVDPVYVEQEDEMKIQRCRRAAIAGIVGAAATALGAIVVQAVVIPTTSVPDARWSYPWSSQALVPVSILWASLHVLVFVGVLGFARSGLAGTSRTARIGLALALGGTALLFIGELASIPIRDQQVDDTGAVIVGGIFGAAIVLTAVGFLSAGIATVRARLWSDWRRFTPLGVGIAACPLLGLNGSDALPAGIALYGLSLVALGLALYTKPVAYRQAEKILPTAQEQAA